MTQPMQDDDEQAELPQGAEDSPLTAASDEPIELAPQPDYEAQLNAVKDQLMRAMAETENVRKRGMRDLEEANKYSITGFARHLVSVLENLQRATASISPEMRAENEQVKNLADGVEMTQRELLAVFEKFGIERIDPLGEKFDHNFHQAMSQIEDDNAEPGTILQVFQAGYRIHDRLLQPALVVLAKSSGEQHAVLDTEA